MEEVTIGDKFTGQFRVNHDTLVDVEKCVRMAKVCFVLLSTCTIIFCTYVIIDVDFMNTYKLGLCSRNVLFTHSGIV